CRGEHCPFSTIRMASHSDARGVHSLHSREGMPAVRRDVGVKSERLAARLAKVGAARISARCADRKGHKSATHQLKTEIAERLFRVQPDARVCVGVCDYEC